MPSILHYTKPGDLVLDGFCGSGMTGVAAQWCGTAPEAYRKELEARWKAEGREAPEWGARRVILENMEGPAPAGLSWVSADGERRCQSHMRRLRSQPEQETGPMRKLRTKVYVGMDVRKDSVMIAVLPEGAREPTLVKRLSQDPRGLRRLLDRLVRDHEVRACYEASGAGCVLERMIRGWGHECEIVAPSLIPRRPGEQRKHDRKDAEVLARLYRAGELVTIRVPTEREERVRDLVRCREAFQREALKSRHYILKFLARRGLVYREGRNWTGKHFAWLRAIQRDGVLEVEDQVVFGECLALLDHKLDRRDELDRQIEALALEPAYGDAVGRLCCLKGISTQAAMVLVTEIGDFRRFEHPGKLMAYLGLVPSEHSSGV